MAEREHTGQALGKESKSKLDDMLAAGMITQEQYDKRLAKLQKRKGKSFMELMREGMDQYEK